MVFTQIYSAIRDDLSLLNRLAKKSYLLNSAKYLLNSVQIMGNRIEKRKAGSEVSRIRPA